MPSYFEPETGQGGRAAQKLTGPESPVLEPTLDLKPVNVFLADKEESNQINEDEFQQFYETETPEGVAAEDLRMEMDSQKDLEVKENAKSLYNDVGLKGEAPSEEDYDYESLVREGGSLTPAETEGFTLPNRFIKPVKVELMGYDFATGVKVRDRVPDPDGLVAEGMQQLHQSSTNTATGAPVDDTAALSKIGVEHIRNGGDFESFRAEMPAQFTDEQLAMSYRVAGDYVKRSELMTFLEDGEVPELDEAALPTWGLNDDDLKANDIWMDSAREVYLNMEGKEFNGTDEELHVLALQTMSLFGWNVTKMGDYVYQIWNGPDSFKRAMYYMIKMYDNKDTTFRDVTNNMMSLGADPASYASLGFGKVGVKGAQLVAKKKLTAALEKYIFISATGAGEGAVFLGLDDFARQVVDVEAGAQKEYDKWKIAQSAAEGAAIGAAMGVGLTFGGEKLLKYGKKLHYATKAMRANPDRSPRTPMSRQAGVVGFRPEVGPGDMNEIHGDGVSSIGIIDLEVPPFVPLKGAGQPTPGVQVGRFINSRSVKALQGRDVTEHTPENIEFLSEVLAREVLAEAQKDIDKGRAPSAQWYKETLAEARDLVSTVFPEVKADKVHRHAFDFALSITSNNQNVRANSKSALKAYKYWRDNGKFPEADDFVRSTKGTTMAKTFREYNALVDQLGVDKVIDLMRTEFSVKEMELMGYKVSDESNETRLPFSVIFGPKVGGGFYSNLQGDWTRLTPDIWFTRTWGRMSGALVKPNPGLALKHNTDFRDNYVGNKAMISKYLGYPAPKKSELTDELIDQMAPIIYRKWSTIKGPDGKAYQDKDNEIHKTSRAIVGRLKPEEIPTSGAQRNMMRDAVGTAVGKLNDLGGDWTISSIQSTVWYPEQRLWDQLGSQQNNKELDYAKAFSELLDIEQGLPGSGGQNVNTGGGNAPDPLVSGGLSDQFARVEVTTGTLRNLRQGPRGLVPVAPTGSVYAEPKANAKRPKVLLVDDAPVDKTHAPSKAKTTEAGTPENVYKELNITQEPWQQLAIGPPADKAFSRAGAKAKSALGKDGTVHTVYPASGEGAHEGATKYLTADGKSGFAIADDGEILGLFGTPERDGSNLSALMLALENGGTKITTFDLATVDVYRQAGFQITKRQKWDQKLMPKGWDKKHFKDNNNGEPDVVQMTYQPQHSGKPSKGEYGEFE